MKLSGVDKTDMNMWANGKAAENFINEVRELNEQSKRLALKKLDAREAGKHDAFEKVLGMFSECSNM